MILLMLTVLVGKTEACRQGPLGKMDQQMAYAMLLVPPVTGVSGQAGSGTRHPGRSAGFSSRRLTVPRDHAREAVRKEETGLCSFFGGIQKLELCAQGHLPLKISTTAT